MSAEDYDSYLSDVASFNAKDEFLFVPGVEMSCGVAHIILIGAPKLPPTTDWRDVTDFARSTDVMSILAHPTRFEDPVTLREILGEVDGVEVWNEREDGGEAPDIPWIEAFRDAVRDNHLLLFGADLHGSGDRIENHLKVATKAETAGSLIDLIREGRYQNANSATGLSLSSMSTDLISELNVPVQLLAAARRKSILRRTLKRIARGLRRLGIRVPIRFKNFVKSRV